MESTSAGIRSAASPAKLRLTAVIANYNYGHFLPVAVEAMVNQSRPADEFILIEDASTDGSERVVDELAQRYPFIKVVRHKVNRGANPTVEEALDMATGDYFYCGAADDMVLPGFFESAMSVLEQFPTAPLCAGIPMHWHEDSDRQFESCIGMPRESGFLQPKELWPLARRGALGLGGLSALYRIADLKALGGFRPSLRWHVDFFVVYALALGRGLAWTAKPTAVFRIHSKSYSNTRFSRPREEEQALAELVRLVVTEMPVEIQTGFRASGILGRLGWPILPVLLAKRRHCSQLSVSFWRVWLATMKHRATSAIARAILPMWLRHAFTRKIRTETKFDLSAMKVKTRT
ncbi:MAG: glycosyltransferase [Opitutus sp.]